ncbi:transmembrane protein [Mycobacterium bohemicum DSM 44277]|uniref:Transmembrane protein n=2 Tax=Mycobacterium bohemicum TaxID=56425 RepID=A0A1X1RCE2_MYCBE|nr:hypothetical protein [Mycobacterium bohemicum]MCV6971928.1 hypothetical protein [Mycobacterium bohemicum]ORV02917.1 hypothetical protein AWB93_03745 [Mycobacterium bohemicum]CPR11743.1 transmembrane protein [Mycobacterium bohemicum DSM 44277]
MTGPHSEADGPGTRPISVAELLARNGTIGAPAVTRRRRRRRGDTDAVTVAELTGEIPIVRDEDHRDQARDQDRDHDADGTVRVAESPADAATDTATATEEWPGAPYWSEPEPRWPKSELLAEPASGPLRSEYPRPPRRADETEQAKSGQSGAEDMSPDPVDHYASTPVEVMDAEVRGADVEDSAYVRSYLRDSDSTLFGGQTLADELARRSGAEKAAAAEAAEADAAEALDEVRADESTGAHGIRDRLQAAWRAAAVVFQSVLAVLFGAGLFVAFDQLWRWNSIVALVLSVLVILGLVVGVRVVRKTEDIASTLIAVAVGALITLGPLALSLQSG